MKIHTFKAATLAFGYLVSGAKASLIFSHVGANDPTTEGWIDSGSGTLVTTGGVMNDLGTGVDSWFVDDPTAVSGSLTHYVQVPDAMTISQASALGWTLSVNARMVTSSGSGIPGMKARYHNGTSTRFGMLFDRETDGDPSVELIGGGAFILDGAGDGEYHLYELIYDPIAGSADLFVDGVERISNYAGYTGPATTRVDWGANSSSTTGRGHFNSVEFSVVPEPSAILLFGLGYLSLTFRRSR